MIRQRVFYIISELIFVLNRHKDTSLSTIELIGSYKETMPNCQSIFTYFCEIVKSVKTSLNDEVINLS